MPNTQKGHIQLIVIGIAVVFLVVGVGYFVGNNLFKKEDEQPPVSLNTLDDLKKQINDKKTELAEDVGEPTPTSSDTSNSTKFENKEIGYSLTFPATIELDSNAPSNPLNTNQASHLKNMNNNNQMVEMNLATEKIDQYISSVENGRFAADGGMSSYNCDKLTDRKEIKISSNVPAYLLSFRCVLKEGNKVISETIKSPIVYVDISSKTKVQALAFEPTDNASLPLDEKIMLEILNTLTFGK